MTFRCSSQSGSKFGRFYWKDIVYENVTLFKKTVATPNCLDAVAERLREEAVDDPDEQGQVDEEDGDAMPAPQVKVAADGTIILDEASTMIETTNYKKAKNDLIRAPLVFENANEVSKSIL